MGAFFVLTPWASSIPLLSTSIGQTPEVLFLRLETYPENLEESRPRNPTTSPRIPRNSTPRLLEENESSPRRVSRPRLTVKETVSWDLEQLFTVVTHRLGHKNNGTGGLIRSNSTFLRCKPITVGLINKTLINIINIFG